MSLRVLLGYALPYWRSLLCCLSLMLLETAVTLVVPWVGGQFAGGIISEAPVNPSAILLALLALFALRALLRFFNAYVLSRSAASILADLRIRIYDHLQTLPLTFYHQHGHGDILALITYEVDRLSNYITGTLLNTIPLLLTALGAVVLMVWIDPLLGVAITILIPLFYLVLKVLGRRLRPLAIQLRDANAKVVAVADEDLWMIPATKTFTREMEQSRRYRQQINKVKKLSLTQSRINAVLQPAIQFMAAAAVVILLWLGSDRVNEGEMTPAALVSFLLYAVLLTHPVSALASAHGETRIIGGTLSPREDAGAEPRAPGRQPRARPNCQRTLRDAVRRISLTPTLRPIVECVSHTFRRLRIF